MSLLLLALALSADVFAAALSRGAAAQPGATARTVLSVGLALGAAQGLMPLLGWSLNAAVAAAVRNVDHWIALVLLALIGSHMIREGFRAEGSRVTESKEMMRNASIFIVALATSIDAAAAGATLAAFRQSLPVACAVLGVVGFACAALGVLLGKAVGNAAGSRAQLVGGLVLVGLGIKIVIEHEFMAG